MTPTASQLQSRSPGDLLFRWLLYAYPAEFRLRYGAQMSIVFRDLRRDAYRQRQLFGLVWLWVTTIIDLGASSFRERLAPFGGPGQVANQLRNGVVAGILGGIVAGVGARLAMRGVSLAADIPPGFTVEGTMLIVVMACIIGAPFGVFYLAVRGLLPGNGLWKGLNYGLLLFMVFLAPPFLFYREGEAALAPPLLTAVLFAPVALGYGMVVEATLARLARGTAAVARDDSAWWRQALWFIAFICLIELAVLGTTSILNHTPRLPPAIIRQLSAAHMRFRPVHDLNAVAISLTALGYFGLSAWMFLARGRAPLARWTALTLLLFGAALFNTGARYYAVLTNNQLLVVERFFRLLQVSACTAMLALLCVFPIGKFSQRWTYGLMGAWLLWAVVWALLPGLPLPAVLLTVGAFLAAGALSLLQRYHRAAPEALIRLARPAAVGLLIPIAAFAIVAAALALFPDWRMSKMDSVSAAATFSVYMWPWVLLPAGICWAMIRHNLWATSLPG